MTPLSVLISELHSGATTSRALVEHCLANATDPEGEGARVYTRLFAERALREADAADVMLRSGADLPLLGIPLSIKDLFDVEGEPTTAGSVVLADAPPASQDALIVQRLRRAGAVILGRTNMTEFAYSGLGLNPHYGTPNNPWDRATGRIPGGSSSGAAVSVTDGMAAAAIGTDTGGSVRIPAALCGLVGWKPTARRVPMAGTLPLAPSLDSVGPLAPTVDCCARLDAVLTGEELQHTKTPVAALRFGVLDGYVQDGLDAAVAFSYSRALRILESKGATLHAVSLPSLSRIPQSNQTAATEAYAWHRDLLRDKGDRYDPHVSARILHGAGMLAAEYLELLSIRRDIIQEARAAFADYNAVLLPTTPRSAPLITDLEENNDAYFEANGAMLRNTSIINFIDGCAFSIPCHVHGEPPVGLMLAGSQGADAKVIKSARAIESALSTRTETL